MRTIILLTIFIFLMELCVARKEMAIMKFVNCPGYKNLTIVYKNMVVIKNKQGDTVSLRFDIIIKKEVNRITMMVNLRKCENYENLDSCEYYMKDIKINNVCEILGKKNQIWSEFISNSNFPSSCPMAAGTYHLNDSNIENSLKLALVTVPIALWKIRILELSIIGNDNFIVGCIDLDVKIYNARRNS